jgi:zinc/manganese transport system substrate-binding protein
VNNLKKVGCIALMLLVIIMSGCKNKQIVKEPQIQEPKVEKIEKVEKEEFVNIVTTNKFLYHMVKDIVKDKHMVDYMLKTEIDQWRYKYSHDSLNNISKKDMFIYIGGGYEPWINSFVEELKKGKVSIVNASRGIRLIPLGKPRKYKETEMKENPYYWLNPEDYKIALANIKNSIEEKDPINREFYETNYSEAAKAVDKTSKEIRVLSDDLKKYTFIVMGDKFDYLIRLLNVKYIKLDEQDLLMINQEKLYKKLDEAKDIVFIYNEENRLETYSNLFQKYKMTPVRIISYEFDLKYSDIMDFNYNSIKNLVNK